MEFKPDGKLSFIWTTEFCKGRRWNVPPYDDQFGYPHVAGRRFENGAVFETRQMPSDDSVDTIWSLSNHVSVDAIDETKIVTNP